MVVEGDFVKIACVSDTHRPIPSLEWPEADCLVHAGDLTMEGSGAQMIASLAWLASAPYEKKFFVWGNHDLYAEKDWAFWRDHAEKLGLSLLAPGELHNFRGYNFCGSPYSKKIWGAFQLTPGEESRIHWFNYVLPDAHVMVSHGPPFGYLDYVLGPGSVGDKELAERLHEMPNLRYHICGHIHENGGRIRPLSGAAEVLVVNACTLDEKYSNPRPPMVVTLE